MDSRYLIKTLISLSLTARREAREAREAARAATDTQTAMIASTEEATAEGRLDAYKEVADAIGIRAVSENLNIGLMQSQLWVNPKFCVNPIKGANRAKFIRGGSGLIRLPPCQQHNA